MVAPASRGVVSWSSLLGALGLRFVAAAVGATETPELEDYWITSDSLAFLVPAPRGAAEEADEWWWLLASTQAAAPWPWEELREAFRRNLTAEGDVPHATKQTISVGGAFFRALPRANCAEHSSPPTGSFMPQVLPRVPTGQCVVELSGLDASTRYRVEVRSLADADAPGGGGGGGPGQQYAVASAQTITGAPLIGWTILAVRACSFLAVLVGVLWQCRARSVASAPHEYTDVFTSPPEEATVGFTQGVVRDQFLGIMKDLLRAMGAFIPLIGPVAFVYAADVWIGVRMDIMTRAGRTWQETKNRKAMRAYFFSVANVLVNLCIIPLNMIAMHDLWFSYGSHWFAIIGLGFNAHTSFATFQRRYARWQDVSGVEIIGWIPAVVLSVLMLALHMQNQRMRMKLRPLREQVLTWIYQIPEGKSLYANLCDMPDSLFKSENGPPVPSMLACFITTSLALFFGFLPHLWMCFRHAVPLWNGPAMWTTLLFVANTSGVAARFLLQARELVYAYRRKCQQLAFFQALSWQPGRSVAMYDPFEARSDDVLQARQTRKENQLKVLPLELEKPAESKAWWILRQLVLVDIQEGRVIMEILVIVCIAISLFTGTSSLLMLAALGKITATTVVSAAVMPVMLGFTYLTLRDARDINLMTKEHVALLHNVVAESNMPLKPQRPLDSHLQQERFLLQLATLIEHQQPAETIASFTVTPQMFSAVLGSLCLLTAASFYNVFKGLLTLHS